MQGNYAYARKLVSSIAGKINHLFDSLVWGFFHSLVTSPVEFTERSHSIARVGTSE